MPYRSRMLSCFVVFAAFFWGISAEIITPSAYAQGESGRGIDYVVNTIDGTADGACETLTPTSDCSLADAINAANGSAGSNIVQFNIPGLGPHRITPTVAFPIITSPIVIDGLSQPNAVCPDGAGGGKLIIEIDGSLLGIGMDGFHATSSFNTLRGLAIFGFGGNGIELNGGDDNTIACNHIGTDSSGIMAGIGNRLSGLYLNNSDRNLIENNVASGNASLGIDLRFGADNNVTQNNLIGTDHTGMAALGNGSHGYFEGTDAADSRVLNNVASGNTGSGIVVKDSDNQILDNLVGVDRTGTGPLGNKANGIVIGPALDSLVSGNTIAYNSDRGVYVFNITTRRVTVVENSIFANGSIGIDLYSDPFADPVTPNDVAPDSDLFANELQNFPVLSSAESNSTSIIISGTLESAFSSQYRIHFYANTACDVETDHGEGETYLGTTSVTTDLSGISSFGVTLAKMVGAGEAVTATATDAAGNTSEFSTCIATVVPLAVGLSKQAATISQQDIAVYALALLLIGSLIIGIGASNSFKERGTRADVG